MYECLIAGVREKQIAFLKVKVYAVGIYADSGIAAAALAPWKGKSADELAQDETMYQKLAQGLLLISSGFFGCTIVMHSSLECMDRLKWCWLHQLQ